MLLFTLVSLALFALAIAMPKVMRLRIRFFKWIHWTWAVRVHEEHFDTLVLLARSVLIGMAGVLFLFSVASVL
ncbi:MAG: hypothetical protein CL483_13115 [Acidobacteria bacterium]|nr:hypothetical protein [Acidobacteriota bacterium]